jgi:hypothetical protein
MCRIKGCSGEAVAHGLCQKHYMRQRRAGNPEKVGKRGPKSPEWRKTLREMFQEQSPRTHARYIKAFKLLQAFDAEARKAAIMQASRPNGSLNVSKLLDIAIMMTLAEDD